MWGTVTPQEKARGALPVAVSAADVALDSRRATCSACSRMAAARSTRNSPKSACPTRPARSRGSTRTGRPDLKQSNRGMATGLRVAIPVLNIHKSRLNDPFLYLMGTNDQPGDYRSSGCASCHVIYANDREPRHSSSFAKCGRDGQTITADPTINRLREGQERHGGYGKYDADKVEHIIARPRYGAGRPWRIHGRRQD